MDDVVDVSDVVELVRAARDGSAEHGLAAVVQLRRLVARWELQQAARARAAGWSWSQLGAAVGLSRTGAYDRYAAWAPAGNHRRGRRASTAPQHR